jgi:predicted nucleic acid-binding protein
MIVIADTTPLNYLILIGHADVLPALYGRVLIPEAVAQELHGSGTPDVVKAQYPRLPPGLKSGK